MSLLLEPIQDFSLAWTLYRDTLSSYPYPFGAFWSEAQFLEEAGKGSLGAYESSLLVGFVLFRRSGNGVEILQLASKNTYLRRGVMKFILGEFLRRTSGEVWLEAHEGNLPARRLYELMGFQIKGIRKGYYFDGGAAVLYSFSRPNTLI